MSLLSFTRPTGGHPAPYPPAFLKFREKLRLSEVRLPTRSDGNAKAFDNPGQWGCTCMLSLGKNTAFWQHSGDLGVPVLMQTISKNTVSAARAFGLLFSKPRSLVRWSRVSGMSSTIRTRIWSAIGQWVRSVSLRRMAGERVPGAWDGRGTDGPTRPSRCLFTARIALAVGPGAGSASGGPGRGGWPRRAPGSEPRSPWSAS